ncbi:penicillin-binding transpeptidase domain-containing protein [Hymenobacter sp. PAMC 26628]|uniref:penicillin-binding transpeptidase domain-containing protein n=1 Tax=Hymenobacter sp. PAMC 26628 TaxID=1484118 RepID=UPI0007701884|nr:penicillin-binding transpeptidase domain-containing protein [Hymenobacter sp. PAMC 26628]AMJ64542.1 peptidoglycan glycosyltransferase [Hymenobacter sp. PAMC 26628]
MQYLEGRRYVVQGIFLLVGLVFATRLFFMQVLDGTYKLAADRNTLQRLVQVPYRGLIYDRKNQLLVTNTPVYDLLVVPREVKGLDSARFCQLLQIPLETLREGLKAARKYSRTKPSPLVQNLSLAERAAIQDNLIDFPGFRTQARMARAYRTPNLAHALGYVGPITPKLLELPKYGRYGAGENVGIAGLESYYEPTLMGRRGVQFKMVNVRGVEKGAFRDGEFDTLSVAGQDLHLSIDAELQAYGEELLAGRRGSIVAIDPKTGEILCFVSAPHYTPETLTGKGMGNRYMDLLRNPDRPLFDRPLMATYPPGSVFKLVNELVALQLGVVTPGTGFACDQRLVHCTHQHEYPANVSIAIKNSCNPYFYQVMRAAVVRGQSSNKFEDARLGLAQWQKMVKTFGLGEKLGVDMSQEKRGLIPSPDFYDKLRGYHHWNFKTVYSLSIGQGEIGITGLQMANVLATIANHGYYYTPHFVKGIGSAGPLAKYRERHYTAVDTAYFKYIIPGMQEVVDGRGGTGSLASLREFGISVAGKTGTVQNPHGFDHATFAAFAPANDPKIAIAVFIENSGFGGSSAAPAAGLMIEKYLRGHVVGYHKRMEDWIKYGNLTTHLH